MHTPLRSQAPGHWPATLTELPTFAAGGGGPATPCGETPAETRQRERRMNVGRAIDVLREEVPLMLRAPPTLDIFAEDVVLRDPSGVIVRGRAAYGTFFAGLRVARRLSFSQPTVEILSLRFVEYRSEILLRLTVEVEAPFPGLDPLRFDALSVYALDAQGLVREHRIDDVTRANLFDRPSLLHALPRALSWHGGVLSPQLAPGF